MPQIEKHYNLIKAVSANTISSLFINGITFLVLPLFTRLLSTTEYGVYGIYSSYFSIYEIIIIFGGLSTVKIAKFTDSLDYDTYVSTILFVPVFFTLFFAIITNIGLCFTKEIFLLDRLLWNFLFVTGLFATLSNIICSKFVVDGEFKYKIVYSAIHVIINISLSLIICYSSFFVNEKYMSRVIGMLVSYIIPFWYIFFKIKVRKVNFIYLKTFFTWATPLFFHTIATILIVQSDRLVLKSIKDFSSVGVYTIATTLATIPMTIQASVENSWSPWFLRKLHSKDFDSIVLVNNFCISIFGFFIAFFIVVTPDVIHIFTNKNYWEAAYILPPLSITAFAEMLYCLPVNLEFYNKKTNFVCFGTIIALCINIILDYIFISCFDIQGAAYATALSRFLLFLLHYLIAKRIEKNKIMSFLLAIIACVCLLGINYITLRFLNNIFIRYLFFIIIGGLFVVYVRRNIKVLKLMRGNDE